MANDMLVERLERIACGFEHESKYGDGLPTQVKQGYLNGAATIREAAAALRATTSEGECKVIGVDWAAPGHDQTVQAELPHPVAWPESHGSITAPPPPLRDAGAVARKHWPLFDRVEFALRDAGFDYDEAFALATKAAYDEAHPAPAQVDEAARLWREVFTTERALRYMDEGMKAEQARIHAETDANAIIAALTAAAKEVSDG